MSANFYGELVIRVLADTSQADAALKREAAQVAATGQAMSKAGTTSAAKLNRAGMAMQNMGRTMTQFVTLPVAAGFAVAGVAAFKFQDSLMKIQNLTGTSAKQTKLWGEELLKLGATTGQTPLRLAESLYFIASSGFQGAEAMKVLNVAAKASAAGLGDVNVTADVLTSVLNAYGHENISAARATDILMKTIEVGKAEPVALATSLGRIMPVAAQLKVPFGQVGGMIAGLTLGGLSSAEAVTALRGTMVALAAPAKMSIDQLKTLGLTYQDVTRSIREKGLIATLQMLYEKTDGNMLAMRKIIPNVRALNGVFSLLGANYKKNVEITKQVTSAQGALNKAMENTRTQNVQKLRVAWATLQGEMIKIGAIILPAIAAFAGELVKLAKAFNALSPGWKNFILGVLAATAALGPFLMVLGSVARVMGLLNVGKGLGGLASLLRGTASAATLASAATAGWAAVFVAIPVAAVAAMVAIEHFKAKAEEARRKLQFQPEWLTQMEDKGFIAAMKRRGATPIVVDGIVYWDYEVKAREKKGRGGVKQALADQLASGYTLTEANARNASAKLAKQVERIVSDAQAQMMTDRTAAALPLAQLMGFDISKGGIRPWIDKLKSQLKELEAARTMLLAGPRKGGPVFDMKLKGIEADIAYNKYQLNAANKVLEDALIKQKWMAQNQPEWDWSGGIKKIKQQIREWKQAWRDFINPPKPKPVKVPEVLLPKLGSKGKQLSQDLANGILKSLGIVVNASDQLSSAATPSAPDTQSTGYAIGQGLYDGMINSLGIVRDAALQLAMAAHVPIKKETGVKSPSKVTERYGREVARGLAKGMTDNTNLAVTAAANMALAVMNAVNGVFKNKEMRKKLETGSTTAGSIQSLVEFATGIGEALSTFAHSRLPVMQKNWKRDVTFVVKAAIALSKTISNEINKAFPWKMAGKGKNKEPKAGKKGQAIQNAAEMSGPVGDLMSFVAGLGEMMATLAHSAMPLATQQMKQQAQVLAQAAIKLVEVVAAELQKAFPKPTIVKKKKRVRVKGGDAFVALQEAGAIVGPVGDVMSFLADIGDVLTTLTTTAVPAMTTELAAKARALASAAVQMAQVIAAELLAAFPAATTKTVGRGRRKRVVVTGGEALARLIEAGNSAGPLGEVLGVAGDALSLLQSMSDIDPRIFEPPSNAFARLGEIVRNMARQFVSDISGISIPDSVMTAVDRLRLLAEALLAVLDVMRGVSEVEAGKFGGDAGWVNMLNAARGMVAGANTILPAMNVYGQAGAVYAGGGGETIVNLTFTGPVNVSSPAQAQATGAFITQRVVEGLATARRRSGRTGRTRR